MSKFAPGGSGSSTSTVTIDEVSVPTVANVSMPLADTEYSYTLPVNTQVVRLMTRGCAKLQLSYTATESGTTYITIPSGVWYELPKLKAAASVTLYFRAPNKSNETLEIESWV